MSDVHTGIVNLKRQVESFSVPGQTLAPAVKSGSSCREMRWAQLHRRDCGRSGASGTEPTVAAAPVTQSRKLVDLVEWRAEAGFPGIGSIRAQGGHVVSLREASEIRHGHHNSTPKE